MSTLQIFLFSILGMVTSRILAEISLFFALVWVASAITFIYTAYLLIMSLG